MREIKFRFFTPDGIMIEDHDGWTEGIGINEALSASACYGYKIMQFTGLFDKNGKEIYEGDIVSNFNVPCVVEFGTQDIGHDWQGVGFYCRERDGGQANIFGGNEIEVIGNIYENPELLAIHQA